MSPRSSAIAGPSRIHPSNESVKLVQRKLTGDTPFFGDWVSIAVDHPRGKIYMYGGVRPDDESHLPTHDFHCLDLETNQWRNLTSSLTFCPPSRDGVFDPFCKVPHRKLPALMQPASTIISIDEGTYFLLFGGHNARNPTSELIAVDLDLLIWWVVDVQGKTPQGKTPLARMSASMVAVDNRLFIFGGRYDFADNAVIHTYSIAEYNPGTRRWTWEVSDTPIPTQIPSMGYLTESVSVLNGQKILLMQGKTSNNPIDMSCESTVLFHTNNHTFQAQHTSKGDFPKGISWYRLASLSASVVPASHPESPSKPRKGGRHKSATSPTTPTSDFPDSVVVVAWVKHAADGDDLVPEAWQYLLPPAERIHCLKLGEKLWDLDLDLEDFVAVGNRLILLGVRADNTQMVVHRPLLRWDVLVEVPIHCLKE
ncbi:hypothetical protein B0H12DRAFT_1188503 [Mycena haematopus]|nr:hypothetical protein B0H12DRAFT_1188503 [Mycena haematopus]